MNDKFHTTKITVEVEVETQFGPASAVSLVNMLLKVPAVKKIEITNLTTDYVPLTEEDSNRSVMNKFPIKLK